MQKFALLHDGTAQGWQATYFAFHIADRLGAPLQVLILDSDIDKAVLAQRAAHVELGGRAARVAIETHIVRNFSLDIVKENIPAIDGLFLPRRLTTNSKAMSLFLEAFPCPMWVVSEEDDKSKALAVLVNDPIADTELISFSSTLAQRLQRSLTALVPDDKFEAILQSELTKLRWSSLKIFSTSEINDALEKLRVGLLSISTRNMNIVEKLISNFVIYPEKKDA